MERGQPILTLRLYRCEVSSRGGKSKLLRKRLLSIVIIVALIFISVYTTKVVIHEREITSAIRHYFFVEKQYTATEIKEIVVSYHLDSLILGYDPYITKVIFSDEPDTIYFYQYKENQIFQSAMGGTTYGTKHNE